MTNRAFYGKMGAEIGASPFFSFCRGGVPITRRPTNDENGESQTHSESGGMAVLGATKRVIRSANQVTV